MAADFTGIVQNAITEPVHYHNWIGAWSFESDSPIAVSEKTGDLSEIPLEIWQCSPLEEQPDSCSAAIRVSQPGDLKGVQLTCHNGMTSTIDFIDADERSITFYNDGFTRFIIYSKQAGMEVYLPEPGENVIPLNGIGEDFTVDLIA